MTKNSKYVNIPGNKIKPIENKALLIDIDITHYHKFYDELKVLTAQCH